MNLFAMSRPPQGEKRCEGNILVVNYHCPQVKFKRRFLFTHQRDFKIII